MGDGRAESWDDSESLARVSHLRREVEERRVSGTGILGANLLAVTWHAARPISQHRLRVAEGTKWTKAAGGCGTGSSVHSRCADDGVRALSLCTLGRGETFP